MTWGGWPGHRPKECVDVFAPYLEASGFAVQLENGIDAYADVERLRELDLVVQCVTMDTITEEQENGLLAAVREGLGFAGWHGGIVDAFRLNPNYQWMTGGQFVSHPGGCIPSQRVELVVPDHPITRGLESFDIPDTEQYYLHVDPGVEVLCTTTFSGEYGDTDLYPAGAVMPCAWTRKWGAGQTFVASWGHTEKDFEVPEAREIVGRGLVWASR
jgi:type 1 glutamine amidotransferase